MSAPNNRGIAMVEILIFGVIAITILGIVYFSWLQTKPETPIVASPQPLDSFILGSLDNSQAPTVGLHPCASNEDEVLKYINQALSYSKCVKGGSAECGNQVATTFDLSALKQAFSVVEDDRLYRVRILSDAFDFWLSGSNNPDSFDQLPSSFYVCRRDYVDYLNTAYNDRSESVVYATYPYELDGPFETGDQVRQVSSEYLLSPSIGVAKLTAKTELNGDTLTKLMDFMYQINYFSLRGFNQGGKIIDRKVSVNDQTWMVEDTVSWEVFNDTPPFEVSSSEHKNIIFVDALTRVVTATGRLD